MCFYAHFFLLFFVFKRTNQIHLNPTMTNLNIKDLQVQLSARYTGELAVISFHLWLKLHKVNDYLLNTLPGACVARECSHNSSGC